jgi:hypothetical protein
MGKLKTGERSQGSSPLNKIRGGKPEPSFNTPTLKFPDSMEITDQIQVEDYDAKIDPIFVNDYLVPYLKDLHKDLMMRSSNP